jgi:hypothetical protein
MSSTQPASVSVSPDTPRDTGFTNDLGLNNSHFSATPFDSNHLSPYNPSQPISTSASPSNNLGSTPGDSEYSNYQPSEFSDIDPFFDVNFDAGVGRIDSSLSTFGFHAADLNRPMPDGPAQVQPQSRTVADSFYPLSPIHSNPPNSPRYENNVKQTAITQQEQTILLQHERLRAFLPLATIPLAPIHLTTPQITPELCGSSHTSAEGIEPASTPKRWFQQVVFQRDNEHSQTQTPGKV